MPLLKHRPPHDAVGAVSWSFAMPRMKRA